jgi:hypothetical protein
MLVALLASAGCTDELVVENLNNPDTDRVLATPNDLEALLTTQYTRFHSCLWGSSTSNQPQLAVMSLENYSGLANFGMGPYGQFPRDQIQNYPGYTYSAEQSRTWSICSEAARTTGSILAKLKETSLGAADRDARAKAFAYFVNGISTAYIAITYDSAAVVTENTGPEEVPELVYYPEAIALSLKQIDSAEAWAGRGMLTIPAGPGWLGTAGAVTAADFGRLIRSYRARIRASWVRSGTQLTDADWTAILADATNGITADFSITTGGTTGFAHGWLNQAMVLQSWHTVPLFFIGMGDVSGGYQAWVAKPLDQRTEFLLITPDQRLPQGPSRSAQQSDTPLSKFTSNVPSRYFRNRPQGEDAVGSLWGFSYYDYMKYYDWSRNKAATGLMIFMTKAEIDLLAAEAHIKKGNGAAALALINATRIARGQLPPLTSANVNDPVPGGANCVPQVPVGPNFTTTACGNMLEAMKWEKRLETAYAAYGPYFLDNRRWGDLPQGTVVHWPVISGEMQARRHDYYNMGSNPVDRAPKGTYGF